MVEHTPTPWVADPDDRHGYEWNIHILDKRGDRICFMTSDGPAEANAAFIVKAVNNHDMLVAALGEFLAIDEVMEGILWDSEPDTAMVKITIPLGNYREARRALKALVGTSGKEKQS